MTSQNPYASPEAELHEPSSSTDLVLASRWHRFVASFIDGLLLGVPLVAAGYAGELFESEAIVQGVEFGGVALAFIVLVVFFRMLSSGGWTPAKKLLGIRIVGLFGERVPGSVAFWLRYMFAQMLLGMIPVYALIDALFIFGRERRCVHDYIAGTVVVQA